jgi:D-alanyl-D-alanine carboxypeptidase
MSARLALTVLVVSLVVLCATAAAAPAAGAGTDEVRTALDGALTQGREAGGAPAATGAVMRCGRVLWSGASGVMDSDSGRPATTSTLFALASTTKPVTATLVLGLVERGKLSLSTPLSRFYPRLPKARRITIRMLLDHTSGLNEYFDDQRIADLIENHPHHRWTRAEVLRAITKTQFTPGTRHSYSNSAYLVLGGVIEKVTHGTLEHAFRTRIAGPLHLASATFTYRPERSNLFAHPYTGLAGNLRDMFAPGVGVPSDYWGPVWSDGGLAGTGPQLARFGDALFEGRLLRAKTLRTMTRLDRFREGLGVAPERFDGRTWLGHDGAYVGYGSQVWHDAKRHLTIGVTTNQTPGSSAATWHALAAAYDKVAPAAAPC